MLPVLLKSGALTNPVPFGTVVQRWLLATERDRIDVGLSFESPSMRTSSVSYTVVMFVFVHLFQCGRKFWKVGIPIPSSYATGSN